MGYYIPSGGYAGPVFCYDVCKYCKNSINPNSTKKFWKSLKNKMQNDHKAESPIQLTDWVKHFQTLLNSGEHSTSININDLNIMENKPLDFPFTPKEVKIGISSLKSGKCSGVDLVLNEFIKISSNVLLDVIVKLFNKILLSGKMPESWDLSLITTLYKSGDPGDCNNYRGLSVTS